MAKTPFEFFQLRCFVTVAEELNFRRAAERLNMTQPPLSRQIMLLEESIGLVLFDRDNRSVRLTPAGIAFRTSAIDLLERAEVAILNARQAARGESGAITMGFVPSASLELVPRIVAALKRDMPNVQFTPAEMMSYEITEALQSGGLDIGLTRAPGRSRDIESIRVVREPFVLALPKGHALDVPGPAQGRELEGVDFVGYSTIRGGFVREVLNALFEVLEVRPNVVQELSQTQTILALVNQGIGVALVPKSATAMIMQNVVFREIDLPEQFRTTIYLNISRHRQSLLTRNVREVILKALDIPHSTI